MMKIYPLLLCVLSFICGCGPSQQEYEQARKRVTELEAQVAALNSELEEIKFGPSRLLAQAKSAFKANSDVEAKNLLADLLKQHPSSPEFTEATILFSKVNSRIAALEEKQKREEELRAQNDQLVFKHAIRNMKKNTDEMKGITWISHRNTPTLDKYVSAYFGSMKDSAASYPLRLKFQYYADDWLFVRSVTVKADDKVYELGKLDFERDHSSGSVWEWADIEVENHKMLKDWLSAKRVVVRFNGDKYYDDFILPQNQQIQLLEVYQVWKNMGGKP